MSISINPNPEDMRRLNAALQDMARETKKTVRDILPAQMRLLATDFAAVTRPKGKTQGDKKPAEARIAMKIRDVYPHPGTIVNLLEKIEPGIGKRFGSLIQRKKFAEAKKITDKALAGMRIDVGLFDFGQLHKSMRWKKRVTHRLVVGNYSQVEAYVRQVQKLSGFAKGGFATASRELGGVRGIPQFATRHKAPGSGRIIDNGDKVSVEMTNGVDYLRDAFSTADESMAISHRTTMVGAVLQRIQDRKLKAAMRRQS